MIFRNLGVMRSLDILMIALLVIGGLNWGLVGVFNFDLVAFLSGGIAWISRIVYSVVGLAAFYEIFQWKAIQTRWNCTWTPTEAHTATSS